MNVSLFSAAENVTVDVPAKGASVAVSDGLMLRLEGMADVEVKLG